MFAEPELDLDVFGLAQGAEEPRPASPPPKPFAEDDDEGPILDYDVDSDLDLRLDEDTDEPPAGPPARGEERTSDQRRGDDRPRRREERSRGESARGDAVRREGDERESGRRRRRRGRGRGGRRDEQRRDEGRAEAAPRSSEYSPPRERATEAPPPPSDDVEDVFDELPDLDEEEVDLPRPATPPAEGRSAAQERDERGGRRRRRRGRGGRSERRGEPREGQRSDRREPRPPPADALDLDAEVDDLRDDEELIGEPPAGVARPRSVGAADDDTDLEEDVAEGRESGQPVHKKIPTWEDAVGVLIDANMAARANNPDRPRGRRGRGGR
jgi:hypothetical protein